MLDGAGFDMLGTESGSTEFTHTACSQMLAWINYTADACAKKGKPALIKCHCSDAGTCPEYDDINFNFLPELASLNMGVLPHTVQTFGFDDSSSGSYGQSNFSFMRDWMAEVAQDQPQRLNVFYGETAYWVNFDINVPLFLPLYADRRISDLRQMQAIEKDDGVQFDGQMNFCSGWEWGYWVQEVAVARASWHVLTESDGASQEDALKHALKPVARTLTGANTSAASLVTDFLLTFVDQQYGLLINGSLSTTSKNTEEVGVDAADSDDEFGPTFKLNGHAYLEGWEAVADVEFTANTLGLIPTNTQPAHISLRALMDTSSNATTGADLLAFYESGARPLLAEMNSTFAAAAEKWAKLQAETLADQPADSSVSSLWNEIQDALRVTSLRSTQVLAVYEAAAAFQRQTKNDPTASTSDDYTTNLASAKSAIETAAEIISKREQQYRVPASRIADWRPNSFVNTSSEGEFAAPGPTAYTFGYLWTAKSLMYWWRDYGIASRASPESRGPCYLNYQNPVDVALGQGSLQDWAQKVRDKHSGDVPADWLTDCLAAPEQEWVLPQDL